MTAIGHVAVTCLVFFPHLYSAVSIQTASCPSVVGRIGTCADECSAMGPCIHPQLCCSNGCGHVCTDPDISRNTCPDLACRSMCPAGQQRVLDTGHCATCACADSTPCQHIKCDAGSACRIVQVQCVTTPCPPLGTCVPDPCIDRPASRCDLSCADGYKQDLYGCVVCECRDSCERAICPAGTICTDVNGYAECVKVPTRNSCCPLPARVQALGAQRCDNDRQCSNWNEGTKCCPSIAGHGVCIRAAVECCCPARYSAPRCPTGHGCTDDRNCRGGQICCVTKPFRASSGAQCRSFRQCLDPEPCPCHELCCPRLTQRYDNRAGDCTREEQCGGGEKCCRTCCNRGRQCMAGVACQNPLRTPCDTPIRLPPVSQKDLLDA